MKSEKVLPKNKSKNRQVISSAIAKKAKSKVKVVEVKLKSKTKSQKDTTKTKNTKKQITLKAKVKAVPKAQPAKKVTKSIETKIIVVNDTPSTENALRELLTSPSEKHLKPFRQAAIQTKKIVAQQKKLKALKTNFLAKPSKKGKKYLVDLRVHSNGTVGYFHNGGIAPGPALARLAEVKGLHMIGLTEYYNASYLDMAYENNNAKDLIILPGVIICTEVAGCKEVFFLILFQENYRSSQIYEFLNELGVPKAAYGRRDYCLSRSLDSILEIVKKHNALAIPSRVDKTPYRQLAITELVEKYNIRCFDLAHPDSPELFRNKWPDGGFTFFTFSSANALGQIGNRVEKITLDELGFNGLKQLVNPTESNKSAE
ncbi:MAG: hypothetical protein KBC84_06315 [Proteobacteria bacterium]|nr:hypothetical protein [Pseudomonadota bacterium]